MKASNIVPDKNISMLLKGPPGFGKTIAACSVAVEGPIYLAYWDKKQPIELLSFFKRFRPDLLDNIEYDLYGSHNANEYLNKLMSFIKDCRYVAIITDSVTNLTSAAVNWSMGFRDPKGAKKDKINPSAVQMIPDFDEYKVETSLVTQALDISRTLPCHIIWTAHPLPSLKIEGSGNNLKVSKVNNIVTYGSKVGAIIPGNFSEIYHLSMLSNWDTNTGKSSMKRIVNTVGVGDDFAKTTLELPAEFDITDKLFWEVWRSLVKQNQDKLEEVKNDKTTVINPFEQPQIMQWKT